MDKVHRGIGMERKFTMLIRVLCSDKSRGFVEDRNLDDMIRRGIVVAFYRPGSNEWVDVKNSHLRKRMGIGYKGVERRSGSRISRLAG
jgi:hypothetical protein